MCRRRVSCPTVDAGRPGPGEPPPPPDTLESCRSVCFDDRVGHGHHRDDSLRRLRSLAEPFTASPATFFRKCRERGCSRTKAVRCVRRSSRVTVTPDVACFRATTSLYLFPHRRNVTCWTVDVPSHSVPGSASGAMHAVMSRSRCQSGCRRSIDAATITVTGCGRHFMDSARDRRKAFRR